MATQIMSDAMSDDDMPIIRRIDPDTVTGWGVDADTDNDPTWPMRNRAGVDSPTAKWSHPSPQPEDVEVLQSVEYDKRPAVFGVSAPPSGLSGVMRRAAFRFSENDWWHWLILIGADRVNMIEGIAQDLAKGHVPNIARETGLAAAWQHDKQGVITRVAAVTAVVGLAAVLLSRRRDDDDHARIAPRRRQPQRERLLAY